LSTRVLLRHPHIRLYLVTDRTQTYGRPLIEVVEAALRGGVDAVQLREKDLPAQELVALARGILPLCRQHGARLLINDRIDLALAVGADGVHLPAASFTSADARRILGDNLLIGVSTHSIIEVEEAQRGGADFAVLGPIYATPSKAVYGEPLGLEALAQATRRTTIPVIAIGGIDVSRIPEVRQGGAAGVAVVRAICGAPSPREAAARLRALMP
jgi:thiamine-phosphate pyrophosphorylase